MIKARALPAGALLARYAVAGNYTDCLSVDVAQNVSLARFIEAFYSSSAFTPERFLLAALLDMPSCAADIDALAHGHTECFAAWTVEAREEGQVLLCDYRQATRSWLMVEQLCGGRTRLFFGSAVVLVRKTNAREFPGRMPFMWSFICLKWFHKLYARTLLWAAARSF